METLLSNGHEAMSGQKNTPIRRGRTNRGSNLNRANLGGALHKSVGLQQLCTSHPPESHTLGQNDGRVGCGNSYGFGRSFGEQVPFARVLLLGGVPIENAPLSTLIVVS